MYDPNKIKIKKQHLGNYYGLHRICIKILNISYIPEVRNALIRYLVGSTRCDSEMI
jgi:hypothetical protein